MGTYDSAPKPSTTKAPIASGTLGEQVLPKVGTPLRKEMGGDRSADAKKPTTIVDLLVTALAFTTASTEWIDRMLANLAKDDPLRVFGEVDDKVAESAKRADAIKQMAYNVKKDSPDATAASQHANTLWHAAVPFSRSVYSAEAALRPKLHDDAALGLIGHWEEKRQQMASIAQQIVAKLQP